MTTRATVLVIDDEPGMRDMLSYELSMDGFEVEIAANGLAAVEAVRKRKFDLAVTDLQMPGMDGVATVAALHELDPDLEVIVVTGYATVETAVACMKRGAYDYLQKPYDIEELKVLLDRAMQKSRLQSVVALYEASQALLATLDHTEIVRLVLDVAKRALRADDIALLLWREHDEGFDVHRPPAESALLDPLIKELSAIAPTGGPSLRILPAASAEQTAGVAGSVLVYPLLVRDRPMGTLAVFRRLESPEFVQSELQKGNVFANQLALSLHNARLYEELGAKIKQLVATQDQLLQAEKIALASQLAGAVAHEINNPLALVQANLESLRQHSSTIRELWRAAKSLAVYVRELPGHEAADRARGIYVVDQDEAHTEELMGEIADATDETLGGVQRIADLVAGFMRLVGRPSESTRPERVDLGELIRACATELQEAPARDSRALDCEVVEPCHIGACREDIRTAFMNVLGYLCAREGNPGARRPIAVRVQREKGRPSVVIHDEALSLTADERARIFDPRVEVETRGGRTMRLNMSLTIARAILARNGASVHIDDADGHGIRFRILFASAEA